jgi:hypothetical protein
MIVGIHAFSFTLLVTFVGLTLSSCLGLASDDCPKEVYESDRALIEDAINAGTLVKGPTELRDSILVQEEMWFGKEYPEQIDFMRSFDCVMRRAAGKRLLCMDVRSLGTGKLLAVWCLGILNPSER